MNMARLRAADLRWPCASATERDDQFMETLGEDWQVPNKRTAVHAIQPRTLIA